MRTARINFAIVVFGIGLVVAATLVVVLLRNPATHANLEDPGNYDRTQIAHLDRPLPYTGLGVVDNSTGLGLEPHERGRLLYVRSGCAGCHGLYAQGGIVGPELWSEAMDADAADFAVDLRSPPNGMPVYDDGFLSDEQIELVLGYLRFAATEADTLGIDVTPRAVAPPTTLPATPAGDGSQDAVRPEPPSEPLAITAPRASIVVDGRTDDWDGIDVGTMTLEAIVDNDVPPIDARVQVAHDDEFIYVLFAVDDDFNWSDIDPHLAGAPAVMWPIEPAAGPHMGGEELSGHPTMGMVDVWYWRLDCPIGMEQGGAVSGPGDGEPGNDAACNFDDEWATDPETRDDDMGPQAENSLLGVFSHSDPVEDADGTWYFEMRRPLQTGDPQDAQFVAGQTARLALAYWDPDAGQNGWGPRDHVQSSNRGWIEVTLTE